MKTPARRPGNSGKRLSGASRLLETAAVILLSASLAGQETLRIGKINIRSLDVFSPDEASRGWVYRAANALHFQTRESVLRKFLLFRQGDPFDSEKLAQTERNLRALPFIKLAWVTPRPSRDGVIDVDVTTQDTWTTEPNASLGSKGGVTTYGFGFVEKNVLGTGRALSFDYDKGSDRTTRSIELHDPYLFGPYWNGDLVYAINSDGREEMLNLIRPFYSFTTPWAAELLGDDLRQDEKVYRGGQTFAMFQQNHRHVLAQYGFALLASDARARRLSAGIESLDDSFLHLAARPGDLLPDDRHFRYVFLRYEDVVNDYLKLNYVDRDLRYEDFSLGRALSAQAGISPAVLGADHATGLIRLSGSQGWRIGRDGFVLGQLSWESRLSGGLGNEIVSGELRYVHQLRTEQLQTFVARLHYDQGWHLDRDVQFFADGQTGLRAYHLHAFEGDKDAILNLEHRLFTGKEILQLVAPGAAVFLDTGEAKPPGQPLRLSDLKSDIGVGLRFGFARAPSTNVLRVDFAYAFNRDPLGRRGFLVSFSSSQAF